MNSQDYFRQGYNCAQAVLLAHAAEVGLDPETAATLAAPFGAGLGGLRRTCGAFTALAMLLSAKRRAFDIASPADKQAFYRQIQDLESRFAARFGSSLCADLLRSANIPPTSAPAPRTPEYYARRTSCIDCLRLADDLFATL